MKKKIAVILAGCGVKDGSEIHEATLTLLNIDKQNGEYNCIAPNILQAHVINHQTDEIDNSKRNVIEESARIYRSRVLDLKETGPEEYDAVIIPGGFGAAKNLSSFAFDGKDCSVQKDFKNFVLKAHELGKPIGAICIAPAVISKIFQNRKKIRLTIGRDPQTAAVIQAMGHIHIDSDASDIVIDEENKIITTPAYMLAGSIKEVDAGISKLVKKILEIA